jgi:hypothetical protein
MSIKFLIGYPEEENEDLTIDLVKKIKNLKPNKMDKLRKNREQFKD